MRPRGRVAFARTPGAPLTSPCAFPNLVNTSRADVLLDTNVISELRTGKPQTVTPRNWPMGGQRALATQYVSVLTWLEIDIGILRLQRRDTAAQKHRRMPGMVGWRARLVSRAGLPWTTRWCAMLRATLHIASQRHRMMVPPRPCNIMTLVTPVRDFVHMGVALFNPSSRSLLGTG